MGFRKEITLNKEAKGINNTINQKIILDYTHKGTDLLNLEANINEIIDSFFKISRNDYSDWTSTIGSKPKYAGSYSFFVNNASNVIVMRESSIHDRKRVQTNAIYRIFSNKDIYEQLFEYVQNKVTLALLRKPKLKEEEKEDGDKWEKSKYNIFLAKGNGFGFLYDKKQILNNKWI